MLRAGERGGTQNQMNWVVLYVWGFHRIIVRTLTSPPWTIWSSNEVRSLGQHRQLPNTSIVRWSFQYDVDQPPADSPIQFYYPFSPRTCSKRTVRILWSFQAWKWFFYLMFHEPSPRLLPFLCLIRLWSEEKEYSFISDNNKNSWILRLSNAAGITGPWKYVVF